MKVVYNPQKERKLISDMGKALSFLLEFCGGYECRECDFGNACYNLSKLSDEFLSIGVDVCESNVVDVCESKHRSEERFNADDN